MKRKHTKVLIVLLITTAILASFSFILLSPHIYPYPFTPFDKQAYENITSTITLISQEGEKEINCSKRLKTFSELNELPSWLPKMFVAVEDKRFYSHNGVDLLRTLSALIADFKSGKAVQGGSTITQQLVKNIQLTNDKTIFRKINEFKLAQRLEMEYSKDEILKMYLNSLYFGNGIYGIADASRYFFDKEPKNLNFSEGATLVGIINNPTAFSPTKNEKACKNKRNTVLDIACQHEILPKNELTKQKESSLKVVCSSPQFDHYTAAVLSEISTNKEKGKKIHTYQIPSLQSKIDCIINETPIKNGYITVIVADNEDGGIVASSSTYPYDVSESRFQPGSTIKPFVSYAPLLENDEIYICSPVVDGKYEVNGYAPKNFRDKYYGVITQERALAVSSNSVALQNCERFGLSESVRFAQRFNLKFDKEDFKNYSTCLGTLKNGFYLRDLLSAYMIIARNGRNVSARYCKHFYQNKLNGVSKSVNCSQVIKDSTAFLLNRMLYVCAHEGSAKILKNFENVCAKTGTVGNENGNEVCYCVAFSPKYTVLSCVSKDDDFLPLSVTGATVPAKICNRVFSTLKDDSAFIVPDSVISLDINLTDLKEGKVLLAKNKTKQKNKKSCYFAKSNVPQKYSSYEDYLFDDLFYNNDFGILNRLVD